MSNEITVNVQVTLSNLGLTDNFQPGQIQVTQNSQLIWKNIVALVAGTDTSISGLVSGITTYGICYMYNLDPTNYVQVGPDNAGAIKPIIRLKPRSLAAPDIPAVFRLEPGITVRAKANAGNCNVLIAIYDD